MSIKRQSETETLDRVKLEIPKDYRVVMLNDDITTVDFVIKVLKVIFNKSPQEGAKIAQEIHIKGKCVICIYPYSIAQMKVIETHNLAKINQFPLKCILERED